jgi:hypothetical protein
MVYLTSACGPVWDISHQPAPSRVLVLGESLQLSPRLAHLLGVSIQVLVVPGVSRPPSLPLSLGIPSEGLSHDDG